MDHAQLELRAMDDVSRNRWLWRITIWGFVLAVLGAPPIVLWYVGYFDHTSMHSISVVKCPRVFDKAHSILEGESPLAPPPAPGVAFTPSTDLPGRVDLTLTWINRVPISEAAVAMQGVYGESDSSDYFIDHSEPAAATGECWTWYHYTPRDDAQPDDVYIRVNGLWPEQNYCFYTVFRINTGYSKPSPIYCAAATWKASWGVPSQAPR